MQVTRARQQDTERKTENISVDANANVGDKSRMERKEKKTKSRGVLRGVNVSGKSEMALNWKSEDKMKRQRKENATRFSVNCLSSSTSGVDVLDKS